MKTKDLKIGFDLDGVILYNPIRFVRPIIAYAKSKVLHKKTVSFFVPKTPLSKFLWYIVHKTSFIPAPGFKELQQALKEKKFEAYIVTARFDSLKDDFLKWMKKVKADEYFKGYFYNEANEQPHHFKKRMIEKLDLDIFVDDNWDIVQYLQQEFKGKPVQIYWIYNLIDKRIDYTHKFPHIKQVVEYVIKNK